MTLALSIFGFIALGVSAIYLMWLVHCALDRRCVRLSRRYCRQKGLEVAKARAGMATERTSGLKTEFTIVQLDCLDQQKRRMLIELLVHPFGVRRVLREIPYPDSGDEEWPERSNSAE